MQRGEIWVTGHLDKWRSMGTSSTVRSNLAHGDRRATENTEHCWSRRRQVGDTQSDEAADAGRGDSKHFRIETQ